MKWIKVETTKKKTGTTIKYECPDLPGVTVESRKRQQPHSNGKRGYSGETFWWYTSYFVIRDGVEKEYHSLKDAKTAAEQPAE